MRCRRIQPHILAFLEGELHPRKQQKVAAHLTTCADCTSIRQSLQQTLHAVQAIEVPEPSPYFWETLEATLHQRIQQDASVASMEERWRWRNLLRVPRPVFAAVAASLLLIVFLPLLRSQYQQHGAPIVGLSGGEDVSLATELDFVKYLDLLEEVDVLEQFDTSP
jgi:anti-sigma factor RsiW